MYQAGKITKYFGRSPWHRTHEASRENACDEWFPLERSYSRLSMIFIYLLQPPITVIVWHLSDIIYLFILVPLLLILNDFPNSTTFANIVSQMRRILFILIHGMLSLQTVLLISWAIFLYLKCFRYVKSRLTLRVKRLTTVRVDACERQLDTGLWSGLGFNHTLHDKLFSLARFYSGLRIIYLFIYYNYKSPS